MAVLILARLEMDNIDRSSTAVRALAFGLGIPLAGLEKIRAMGAKPADYKE